MYFPCGIQDLPRTSGELVAAALSARRQAGRYGRHYGRHASVHCKGICPISGAERGTSTDATQSLRIWGNVCEDMRSVRSKH